MSDIKNLPLEQAQEKMQVRAEELRTILKQAETSEGTYDASKITVAGVDIKNSNDLVAEVKKRNAELDELGQHIEGLRALKSAASQLDAMGKARPGFIHPAAGDQGDRPANLGQFKSLGELVTQSKGWSDWRQGNKSGGTDLKIDMLPSDFLAKAARFATIGNKALMTTGAGFAPESIRMPGFVDAVTRPIQLLDILPMGSTTMELVKFMEETTRTHAAAETAEGGTFAESTFTFTERSSPVEKITDSLPVTDEQLEDVALIESYINGRLSFGVRQRLDRQCLIGDGSAPNLRGIMNTSGIQTQAKGADEAMDALYKAMTKVRVTGRAIPTHHNIHPNDWQDIRLKKTADGIYIFGSPTEAGPARLWGLPVVENEALTEGTALVGSFDPSWIMLVERRGIDIQVGYVGTQFGEGKRTIRADMRAALVVMRPAAFCQVTGI